MQAVSGNTNQEFESQSHLHNILVFKDSVHVPYRMMGQVRFSMVCGPSAFKKRYRTVAKAWFAFYPSCALAWSIPYTVSPPTDTLGTVDIASECVAGIDRVCSSHKIASQAASNLLYSIREEYSRTPL